MNDDLDHNAAIWKSDEVIDAWAASTTERERTRIAHWQTLARLLPFEESHEFRFLDLGAGTGSATRVVLDRYPHSTALLAEFSPQMIAAGTAALDAYDGRFRYVEFDLLVGEWPEEIPGELDAVITSLCVHHLPDDRKRELFAEIYDHLAPGAWFFNYDPVSTHDAVVAATWERTGDHDDPSRAHARHHRSPLDQARHENHVRHMIPLDQQLEYVRSAGYEGVDVYWKYLENVIYGGRRPR
jgi:SAM-dependent methyltransferase